MLNSIAQDLAGERPAVTPECRLLGGEVDNQNIQQGHPWFGIEWWGNVLCPLRIRCPIISIENEGMIAHRPSHALESDCSHAWLPPHQRPGYLFPLPVDSIAQVMHELENQDN